MNPDELARYRVTAEQLRKARRLIEAQNAKIEGLKKENAALKEGLLAADSAFDNDNAALFAIVHENHRVNAPLVQVFHFE